MIVGGILNPSQEDSFLKPRIDRVSSIEYNQVEFNRRTTKFIKEGNYSGEKENVLFNFALPYSRH